MFETGEMAQRNLLLNFPVDSKTRAWRTRSSPIALQSVELKNNVKRTLFCWWERENYGKHLQSSMLGLAFITGSFTRLLFQEPTGNVK